MPSCLAVFMLMPMSNFLGRSTGRSAGLAPLRFYPRTSPQIAYPIDLPSLLRLGGVARCQNGECHCEESDCLAHGIFILCSAKFTCSIKRMPWPGYLIEICNQDSYCHRICLQTPILIAYLIQPRVSLQWLLTFLRPTPWVQWPGPPVVRHGQ